MSRNRSLHAWSIALACALVLVFSASPERVVNALSGVVISDAAGPALASAPAQDPVQEPPAGRGGGGRGQGANAGPRPYAQVITDGFKTSEGIFKVHRGMMGNTDSVLFEIPESELNKDFVWNVSLKKTALGAGYGGQSVTSKVVRFTTRGDRILVEARDYSITSTADDVVAEAVADANYPAIIRALPVAAYGPNHEAVVDVTPFVMDGVTEFSVRAAVGGRGMDNSRSFLEGATAFPQSVNMEATLTFQGSDTGGGGRGGGGGGAGGAAPSFRGPSGTIVVHHSLMKLPDQPMMARNYDPRVGFETEGYVDFGTDEHRSVREQIIHRFRMEKKDPAAAVSDPVKPIVFYMDSATPAKWIPYVKRGVESWQAAFEAAGFRNAIQALPSPTDPTWSAEDARYSVIHWVPTQEESQSFILDPRSGEILSASVDVYPNVAPFDTTRYFVLAAAVDKRAQKLPLPDEIQGELIRAQVAHQIGHALGFPHNEKSSAEYTVAQVRDPKWVKENGFVPSVMDVVSANYVAQPEDGVDPVDLLPRVGPYDKFAVTWGYKPVPSAKTPAQEKATLDTWVKEQETKRYLRFSTEGAASVDPGQTDGAVGDADAVMATSLGLKNLSRVADMMLPATSTRVGDPWDDLEQVYGRMVAQWGDMMGHVVRVVGGLDSQQIHVGQQGDRFRTVPKARQAAALQFLLDNAFQVPAFMIKTDVLRRIQASGAVNRVRTAQEAVLTALLQNQRLDRMTEQLTIDGPNVAYAPLQFLMDLRAGVWSELAKPGTAISIYRRNLQRAYLDEMDNKLKGTPAASAEIKMLVKGELQALDRQLQAAVTAPGLDENTRRHLTDAREAIATSLDPRVQRPAAPAGAAAGGGRGRGGIR